jgi:hypothetical protein
MAAAKHDTSVTTSHWLRGRSPYLASAKPSKHAREPQPERNLAALMRDGTLK